MVKNDFEIVISDAAKADIFDYISFIEVEYGLPVTAVKIYDELIDEIYLLAKNPSLHPIRTGLWYYNFGNEIRRFNYKSRAIIYNVENKLIRIHRVASQSEISNI
jgi:plasmid stabilization system protein ParE